MRWGNYPELYRWAERKEGGWQESEETLTMEAGVGLIGVLALRTKEEATRQGKGAASGNWNRQGKRTCRRNASLPTS